MALSLVTAPTAEPITLSEAKLHLRVDHSVDDDLITTLCQAAQAIVETAVHRLFGSQAWDDKRDSTPCDGVWRLPFPPVSSVTSISYVDHAGATQTWSSSEYTVVTPSGPQCEPAYIVPAYGYSWPQVRSVPNAITVRFVCGYTSYPAALVQAMKLLIEHWYANRGAVVVGTITSDIGLAFNALTWAYKAVA